MSMTDGPDYEAWLTVGDVSRMLGRSEQWVRRHATNGKLRAVKRRVGGLQGPESWAIDPVSLEAYQFRGADRRSRPSPAPVDASERDPYSSALGRELDRAEVRALEAEITSLRAEAENARLAAEVELLRLELDHERSTRRLVELDRDRLAEAVAVLSQLTSSPP
jgi:hypothetical protein